MGGKSSKNKVKAKASHGSTSSAAPAPADCCSSRTEETGSTRLCLQKRGRASVCKASRVRFFLALIYSTYLIYYKGVLMASNL